MEFIYATISRGKRANHLRDRDRIMRQSASVQSSERPTMLEDRVGVVQELLLNMATSKDKDA